MTNIMAVVSALLLLSIGSSHASCSWTIVGCQPTPSVNPPAGASALMLLNQHINDTLLLRLLQSRL